MVNPYEYMSQAELLEVVERLEKELAELEKEFKDEE